LTFNASLHHSIKSLRTDKDYILFDAGMNGKSFLVVVSVFVLAFSELLVISVRGCVNI